jgi:hypothetical protein
LQRRAIGACFPLLREDSNNMTNTTRRAFFSAVPAAIALPAALALPAIANSGRPELAPAIASPTDPVLIALDAYREAEAKLPPGDTLLADASAADWAAIRECGAREAELLDLIRARPAA